MFLFVVLNNSMEKAYQNAIWVLATPQIWHASHVSNANPVVFISSQSFLRQTFLSDRSAKIDNEFIMRFPAWLPA